MAKYQDVITNIENSEEGPHIGAIFDFDGTIISGFSATVFLKEQIKRGDMSLNNFVEMLSVTGQMAMGKIGFSGMMASAAKLIAGVSEQSYEEMGEELFNKQIKQKIYPGARAIIEAHRAKGHTLAIISSATPYQVEPAARDLDIEHVLCTRYEVENGEFNGNIVRPVCFGEGKVIAAEQLSDNFGVDLDQSYFYSDSYDDIELLERVGKPQAMNPNKKLTKVAEQRGWQIRRLSLPAKPTLFDRARSIAATGSLVTSFINGLPILAMTGSRQDAVNFSIARFGDISSAMIGMKLDVRNEKYIWTDRPCVFIFNHQSGADLMIIAKLLRKDIAGVGKKELAKIPLLGKVFEYAGTVMIDRSNSASAIEAMSPLVDKMLEERMSVCIAPEGTRSNSRALGKFKKGAFHLAMQAGVPIVPIVIHNAYDILPGDGKVFQSGTVKIDVLEPVPTTNWKASTMNQHVADVEQMYLDALGQTALESTAIVAGVSGRKTNKSKARKPVVLEGQNVAKKATQAKVVASKAKKKVSSKKTRKKTATKKVSAKLASKGSVSTSNVSSINAKRNSATK